MRTVQYLYDAGLALGASAGPELHRIGRIFNELLREPNPTGLSLDDVDVVPHVPLGDDARRTPAKAGI